jgi:hypothetical protein
MSSSSVSLSIILNKLYANRKKAWIETVIKGDVFHDVKTDKTYTVDSVSFRMYNLVCVGEANKAVTLGDLKKSSDWKPVKVNGVEQDPSHWDQNNKVVGSANLRLRDNNN